MVSVWTKDSDVCLQQTWKSSKCKTLAQGYCTGYGKLTQRCCPETCKGGIALTENDCNSLRGSGACTYPFIVEQTRC